jgi:hypothetical protein
MKNYKIINYNTSYKNKYYLYIKSIISNKCEEYINYCIDKAEGDWPSLMVIDENDNIVGCHMFFPTRVFGKEEIPIAWGHDTFLDEDFRSSAGLDFVIATTGDNTMGIGLSEINRKIQKKLKKTVLLDTVYNYFLIDLFFPLGIVKKMLMSKVPSLKRMDVIKTGVSFKLVNNANEILVPNNGYWFKNKIEYDLLRNQDFINYRFIYNKVFKYFVYEYHNDRENSCYFVVRPILYRGIPAILLVDYRFWGGEELMKFILCAVKKIARRNCIGLIQTTGGIKEVEDVFCSRSCIKRHGDALIHKSLGPSPSDHISITPADADVDFNR